MARKDEFNLDDDFDLDDFGADFNPDPNDPQEKDDRNPVIQTAKSALKNLKEGALNGSILKRLMRKSLPPEYREGLDAIDSALTAGKGLYNTAVQDSSAQLRDTKRTIQRILPGVKNSMPKTHSLLERVFKDNDTGRDRDLANVDPLEAGITTMMAEMMEAKSKDDGDKEVRDKADETLRQVTQKKRFDITTMQVEHIRKGISRLVGYQESITNKYQRKSLELSYRKYYVLRDMLDLHKSATVSFEEKLSAIAKNTALPEFVKMQTTEAIKQHARDRLIGFGQRKVGDFARNFGNQVRENIEKKVKEATQGFNDRLQSFNDMAGMMADGAEMGGGREMTVEMIASLLSDYMSQSAIDKFAPKITKWINSHPEAVKGGLNIQYVLRNIPGLMNEWTKSETRQGGLLGRGLDMLKSTVGSYYGEGTKLVDQGMENSTQAAYFDNQTHRSVNEVIPGYLSRILQSIDIMRTGDASYDRTVFNQDKNTFTTMRSAAIDAKKRILPLKQLEEMKKQTDEFLATLDPTGQLSPQAREGLAKQIFKDLSQGNTAFNPSKYADMFKITVGNYDVKSELSDFMTGRFGMDYDGKIEQSEEKLALRNKLANQMRGMIDVLPSLNENLNRYISTGNRDLLIAMGMLSESDGHASAKGGYLLDAFDEFQQGQYGEDSYGGSPAGGGSAGKKRRKPKRKPKNRGGNNGGYGGGPTPADPTPPTPPTLPPSGGAGFSDPTLEALNRIAELLGTKAEEETSQAQSVILGEILIAIGSIPGNGGGGGGPAGPERADRLRRLLRFGKKTGKGLIEGLSKFYSGTFGGAGAAVKGAGRFVGGALGRAGDAIRGVGKRLIDDVYVPGSLQPLLLAYKMRAGEYFDQITGEVIKSVKDIKGAIVDKDGNVVLSVEDYLKGLVDLHGRSIKERMGAAAGLLRGAGSALGAYGKFAMAVWKAPLKIAKFGGRQIKNVVNPVVDIYVKGESTPRLLANLLKKGYYLNARSKKPIFEYKDIDDDVIDPEGNVVLAVADMLSGLVDADGRDIKTLSQRITGMAKKALSVTANAAWGAAKAVGRYYKRSMVAMKNIAAGGLKGLKGLGGRLLGGRGGSSGGGGGENVQILAAIYDMLDERLPKPKKMRIGSWQEQRSRESKEKPGALPTFTREEKAGNPILRCLIAMGGMIGGFFTKTLAALAGFLGFKKAASAAGDLLGGGDDVDVDGRRRRGRRGRAGRRGLRGARGRGGLLRRGLRAGGRGLATAGRFVGRQVLMQGGRMALGALGALGAPVLIAGAVIGVGAYLAYKYFKDRPDPMQKLRYAQYGVDVDEKDQTKKIGELEGSLEKMVIKNGTGPATLSRVPMDKIMAQFEIDPDDDTYGPRFTTWFEKRFKPVFLSWHTLLAEYKKGTPLLELDDKLPDGSKVEFARRSMFKPTDPGYPYDVAESPFKKYEAPKDMTVINQCLKDIELKFGAKAIKTPTAINQATGQKDAKVQAAIEKARAEGRSIFQKTGEVYNTDKVTLDSKGNLVRASYQPGSKFNKSREIDDLTTIRMKAYGVLTLDVTLVNALKDLELIVRALVTYQKGQAIFNGDSGKMFEGYGPTFCLNMTNSYVKAGWEAWFNYRFLPVCLNFLSMCYEKNPGMDAFKDAEKLPPDVKLIIAQEIVATTSTTLLVFSRSVWGVTGDVNTVGFDVNTDPTYAQVNIDNLKALAANKAQYNVPKEQKLAAIGQGVLKKDASSVKTGDGPGSVNSTGGGGFSTTASIGGGIGGGAQGGMSPGGTQPGSEPGSTGGVVPYTQDNQPPSGKVVLKGKQKEFADSMMAFAISQGLRGEELAIFMGQVDHESGGFIYNQEIASGQAYEGRQDLGNTQPGDGVRYKGRGWIQLTGRANYKIYGDALGIDLVNHPELAEQPEVAERLAVLYWMKRVRPKFAQKGMSIETATRAINGGTNGLKDRIERTEKWRQAAMNAASATAGVGAGTTGTMSGGGSGGGTEGPAPANTNTTPNSSSGPITPADRQSGSSAPMGGIGGPGGSGGGTSGGSSAPAPSGTAGTVGALNQPAPPAVITDYDPDNEEQQTSGAAASTTAMTPAGQGGGESSNGSSATYNPPAPGTGPGGYMGNNQVDSPATMKQSGANQQLQSKLSDEAMSSMTQVLTESLQTQKQMAATLTEISTKMDGSGSLGGGESQGAIQKALQGLQKPKGISAPPVSMFKKSYK